MLRVLYTAMPRPRREASIFVLTYATEAVCSAPKVKACSSWAGSTTPRAGNSPYSASRTVTAATAAVSVPRMPNRARTLPENRIIGTSAAAPMAQMALTFARAKVLRR